MVELDYVKKSSSTLREDYEMISKKTNKSFEELYGEKLVGELSYYELYLIGEFNKLNLGRSGGMNGPSLLTYQDIAAYCDLKQEVLTPWEVDAIKTIDIMYIRTLNEQIAKDKD